MLTQQHAVIRLTAVQNERMLTKVAVHAYRACHNVFNQHGHVKCLGKG